MTNETNTTTPEVKLGKVYTLKGKRRRYLAIVQDMFGRWGLQGITGSLRGCQICNTVEAEALELADDQTLEFVGANARKLAEKAASYIYISLHYSKPMQALDSTFLATIPVVQGATKGKRAVQRV